jgi:hypothetical protein
MSLARPLLRLLFRLRPAVGALLLAAAVPAMAQPATPTPASAPTPGEQALELSLKDLGITYPLRLKTVFGQASVPLNLRADEIATSAELELRLAYSPSLRYDLSHLTVLVNDEVIWTRPLTAESAGGGTYRVPINPLLLLNRNQIRFELVAHYAKEGECEDPAHSTLWADISNDSRIRLRVRTVDLPPTLEKMPAPWFDVADQKRLVLPFVFPSAPSPAMIRASGIVAAWFGAQADYRGADFPVVYGPAPAGNAVLFQLGASSSELRAIRNPVDSRGQLLVFSAPDEAALIQLTQAFAMGSMVMRGDVTRVSALTLPEPQGAWRSPRWSSPDEPLALKDRLLGPASVMGLNPGPIAYEFTLPPDLYFLGKSGATIDLGYRASRTAAAKSSLNVSLNNQYLGSALLNPRADVITDEASRELSVEVPPTLLRAKNRLIAQFQFLRDTGRACEDFRNETLQGSIDPRSTIELASYAHFAEMPALQKLVDGGFPFSKYADLSQTAIVLPDTPSPADVSAALIVLGHVGRWSQDAAIYLNAVPMSAVESVADRDLLIVAPVGTSSLPTSFDDAGVLRLNADGAELKTASALAVLQARIEGRQVRDAERYAGRVLVQSGSKLGTMLQFESPLAHKRTVVAIRTTAGADPRDVALTLTDPGQSQYVQGGLVLVTPTQVTGYQLGETYSVGSLPWWFAATRWLSLHPYLLVPLAVLLALVAGSLAVGLLRRRAAARVPPTK